MLAATPFLHGLIQAELTRDELEFRDPDCEVSIGIKATKRIAEQAYMTQVKGLVSVTIPFYNRVCFFAEALESVLTQTYPH